MATHPGVYCLRTNVADWDDAALWRTHTTLTDIEAVFRSLKSELGLRPIHHRKPVRAEGYLCITVIAHQAVQVIRKRLAAIGERASFWTPLRPSTSPPTPPTHPPAAGDPDPARHPIPRSRAYGPRCEKPC